MDFDAYPFGNAYYDIAECRSGSGYNKEHDMYCWVALCGTSSPPQQCFSKNATTGTTILCQHGEDECKVNLVEGCAKSLHPMWTDYMPFFVCIEDDANPTSSQSIQKCATSAHLNGTAIEACAMDVVSSAKVSAANAYATAKLGKSKLGTPWVVVNGKVLQDPASEFRSSVCNAWSGAKPAICSA
jgi:interferon gamma-inducible protein 30